MATLVRSRGRKLEVPGPRTYFKKHRFKNGLTLYQILFRKLVSGEPVGVRPLHRELKMEEPLLSLGTIEYALKKIRAAAARDKKLGKLHFVSLPKGGATSVMVRRSPKSRYTEEQLRVLMQTIREMHSNNKSPANPQIRETFLAALRKAGLAENVSLSDTTINRAKKKFRLLQ